MPRDILAVQQLLPELSFLKQRVGPRKGVDLYAEKRTPMEVCPRCATRSWSIYDRRWVVVRDEPMRRAEVRLVIRKRRFMCGPCKKPFTEPVQGIIKGSQVVAIPDTNHYTIVLSDVFTREVLAFLNTASGASNQPAGDGA